MGLEMMSVAWPDARTHTTRGWNRATYTVTEVAMRMAMRMLARSAG